MRCRSTPALPAAWRAVSPPRVEQLPGAVIRRWTVVAGQAGIEGAAVAVHGLDVAVIDALVRIALADGRVVSRVLRPAASSFTVETSETVPVLGYLQLGVEHILFGIDHLLFVLGLILLVGELRLLVKTITAFTVAHSITLALATLGVVHVPQAPVEAVIALSIVFLAAELVRQGRGESGLTARRPWLVAFAFGLLHGLGFAGALSEVGLPPGDVPAGAAPVQRRRRGGAARVRRCGRSCSSRRPAACRDRHGVGSTRFPPTQSVPSPRSGSCNASPASGSTAEREIDHGRTTFDGGTPAREGDV